MAVVRRYILSFLVFCMFAGSFVSCQRRGKNPKSRQNIPVTVPPSSEYNPDYEDDSTVPPSRCPTSRRNNTILIAHETACDKYYSCQGGIAYPHKCQSGLHFNKRTQSCDYPEEAGCRYPVVTQSPVEKQGRERSRCPSTDKFHTMLIPHETACDKFYICDRGTPHPKTCQQGLHFNPKISVCDYPRNAACELGEDGFNIPNDGSGLCPPTDGVLPLLVPHERDCDKFYICSNGIPNLKECQPGLHFNPKLSVCDYPNNAGCAQGTVSRGNPKDVGIMRDVREACPSMLTNTTMLVPHPFDCGRFYMCEPGKFHDKECPSGLHFNAAIQNCDYPQNAKCRALGNLQWAGVSSPYCPTVDGDSPIFFHHPSNCSIYYMCSHGLAYEFQCPARLHFNIRLKICDYEDKARCPSDRNQGLPTKPPK